MPRVHEAMDQPSIDGVNTWFVSKAASELGLKVAISGVGGDELFGGYDTFASVPRLISHMSGPARVPGVGKLSRALLRAALAVARQIPAKAAGLVEYGGTYPGAWFLRRGLFMPWELPSLLGADAAREGLKTLDLLALIGQAMEPVPSTSFAKVALMESGLYMKNQLLRDTDWAGMAHSLEVRTPLVDRTLLEALAPILATTGGGKQLLAKSPAEPLPDEIVERSKSGFSVPTAQWAMNAGEKHKPSSAHASRTLARSILAENGWAKHG